MSPLAEVLHGAGITVQGSDVRESAAVEHLRNLGIHIQIGHRGENISGCDYIIRTAAVHDDNPEIIAAHEQGIPVFERAQAWGAIMQNYQNAVCISMELLCNLVLQPLHHNILSEMTLVTLLLRQQVPLF